MRFVGHEEVHEQGWGFGAAPIQSALQIQLMLVVASRARSGWSAAPRPQRRTLQRQVLTTGGEGTAYLKSSAMAMCFSQEGWALNLKTPVPSIARTHRRQAETAVT